MIIGIIGGLILAIYLIGVVFFAFIEIISFQNDKPNPPSPWLWCFPEWMHRKKDE